MSKSNYDKLMQVNNEKLRLKENRDYKSCGNKDSDCCVIWSACRTCYYYIETELLCPNCERIMPNKDFRKGKGCQWCQE
jgi:hypothetical protein